MIRVDKNYKRLVGRLPLVPIESDAHLAKAHALLVELAAGGRENKQVREKEYMASTLPLPPLPATVQSRRK